MEETEIEDFCSQVHNLFLHDALYDQLVQANEIPGMLLQSLLLGIRIVSSVESLQVPGLRRGTIFQQNKVCIDNALLEDKNWAVNREDELEETEKIFFFTSSYLVLP